MCPTTWSQLEGCRNQVSGSKFKQQSSYRGTLPKPSTPSCCLQLASLCCPTSQQPGTPAQHTPPLISAAILHREGNHPADLRGLLWGLRHVRETHVYGRTHTTDSSTSTNTSLNPAVFHVLPTPGDSCVKFLHLRWYRWYWPRSFPATELPARPPSSYDTAHVITAHPCPALRQPCAASAASTCLCLSTSLLPSNAPFPVTVQATRWSLVEYLISNLILSFCCHL